jgi:hypothetical protein
VRRRVLLLRSKLALVGLRARNARSHFDVAARAHIFNIVVACVPPTREPARHATPGSGYCRGPGRQPGCIYRTRQQLRDTRRWTWR